MIMEIENIKALVEGKKLNAYQIALAKLEFDKLIASQGTPNQALSMSGVGGMFSLAEMKEAYMAGARSEASAPWQTFDEFMSQRN